MSIEFSCENCGKFYAVSDQQAGKKARCKQCGTAMRIPGDAAAPPSPALSLAIPNRPRAASAVPPGPPPMPMPMAPPFIPPAPAWSPPPPPRFSSSFAATGDSATRTRTIALAIGIPVLLIVLGAGLAGALRAVRHASTVQVRPISVIDAPPFPDRGVPSELQGGVRSYTVHFAGDADVPGQRMTLWIYLPPGQHARGSLPCVLVAPAGTNLMTGNDLGDGDRAEHLPYVHAGFAVVGYSLDGILRDKWGALSETERTAAMKAFMASHGGVVNARNALEYTLAKLPEVDPARIFAAGHSSAATVALDFAAQEPRLRGCAAYAPATDIEARFHDAGLDRMERRVVGARQFAHDAAPLTHAAEIHCSVYLFHADDDTNVPADDNAGFATAMQAARKSVQFVRVPSGGHYNSMIQEGIPGAIRWMGELTGTTLSQRVTPTVPQLPRAALPSVPGLPISPVSPARPPQFIRPPVGSNPGGAAVAPPSTPAQTGPAGEPAVWTPDAALAASLGAEETIGGWAIRLPAGFKSQTGSGSNVRRTWVGPAQPRGTPRLSLTIMTVPGDKPKWPVVITQPGQTATGHPIVSFGSKVEFGTLNGWPFTRATHEPTAAGFPRAVTYYAYDGDQYISVRCTCVADDAATAALMEAAVRTLHKTGG